jgi:hypothetical protein
MFDGEKDIIWLRGFDAAGAFVTDGFEPNVPDDFYGHPMQYTLAVAPDLVTFSWRKVGDTAITGLGTPLDIGEVGYPTRDGGTFIAACGDVTVGHVTVRSQSLVAAWATPADEGWPDDTAVQRIRRLCDERGVTLVIDGEGTVGSTKLGIQKSGSFLDLLHDPADADLGLLQEARVGGMALRYRPRRSRYNLAPVWTINAKTDGFQNPFEPVRDDQQILNDITVNRIDGSSFHRVDEASVDKNGTYDGSVSLSLDTDRLGRLKNQAGERIHFGTWAGTRYPQVTVQIETAQDPDAVKAKWKALRVGDVIRLTVLPPQHPQWPDHVDLVVEGWSETLSPFGWTVTMNCSPADPWQRAIYGTFRCFPRNGRIASAVAVDADEIPYTDGGSGWTTDPDAYPMQLILGGSELVEVSGVSGSDPQILAVSERNLNGLGRAHPAGASVVPDTVSVIGL